MGKELETTVRIGRATAPSRVLLETTEIIIRGTLARRVKFESISDLTARDGRLEFTSGGEPVSIELGTASEAWLESIRNPRTRVQKLGVSAEMRVCAIGPAEADALEEIAAVVGKAPGRRLAKDADVVLLFAGAVKDLARLKEVEEKLAPKGAVWVLWPKGRKDFAHEHVVSAARRAGLVQTRSMGFSETNTGLRLVRPAKKR